MPVVAPLPSSGLGLDGIDLATLAEHVPTPFYAYSAARIRARIDALQQSLRVHWQGQDTLVCYAVKANPNLALLQLMGKRGLGADIVSAGEMQRSLRAGIPAERIVFSGVGKTAGEMREALAAGIWKFNVESHAELLTLHEVACAQGIHAHAAVRINPDVDAQTHAKISTGRAETKFGVSIDEARRWFATSSELPNVQLDGLHVHIGSQITRLPPFQQALQRVAEFWRELEAAGHAIRSIDVGGGLGVCYRSDVDTPVAVGDYVAAIQAALGGFEGRLVLEPGRHLVAEAGMLLTRVIRVKAGEARTFLVVDAAMNDLLRPTLYDAWHDIVPVLPGTTVEHRYDVVGPVCETSDLFACDRSLPTCAAGDLLAITAVGAYGASMASTYNSRPLLAEILLDDGRYAVIRRRQEMDDMLANESFPEHWLHA